MFFRTCITNGTYGFTFHHKEEAITVKLSMTKMSRLRPEPTDSDNTRARALGVQDDLVKTHHSVITIDLKIVATSFRPELT